VNPSQQIIAAARELSVQVDRLKFQPPVSHVYNPLAYAWKAHEEYLRRFGNGLIASLAASAHATPAQVAFSFARNIGILPLTGTSNAEHMKQDLAAHNLTLPPDAVHAIESLAG
jgi:diketogulonate reductase-like aldo/keto reductase